MNNILSYQERMSKMVLIIVYSAISFVFFSCSQERTPVRRGNPNQETPGSDNGTPSTDSDETDLESTGTGNGDVDIDGDIDGDADADSAADVDADTNVDGDIDSDGDSDADSDADLDADTDSDAEADADVDMDSDGDGDSDSDVDSDIDSDADTDGDTDSDSDSDGDQDADSDADADTDSDSDSDGDICEECRTEEIGMGTDAPWDLESADSGFVTLDEEGALIIDREVGSGQNLIWIVNTLDNSVSKIDTDTRAELARYRVGCVDPSRTSVAPNGDAYVACRGSGQIDKTGVTKIVADIADCVDRNNNGVIDTSSGPGDVLAPDYPDWADDECVIWYTYLRDYVRGIAVQAIPDKVEIIDVADGPPEIKKTPGKYYVWAGGNYGVDTPTDRSDDDPRIFKLDADTGEVLIDVPSPIMSYGFALDGRDRLKDSASGPYLWISGDNENDDFAHVDTSQCTSNETCTVTPCIVNNCGEANCSAECDDAVMAYYSLERKDTYGITVDCKQRVWIAGLSEGIKRYDPSLPPNERFREASGSSSGAQGISADAKGFIYGVQGGGLIRQDAEDLSTSGVTVIYDTGGKGAAVDRTGNVWVIPQGTNIDVVIPGADLLDNTLIPDALTTAEEYPLDSPYTYSDMSGQQLMLASNDPGYYRQIFTCEGVTQNWHDLTWDVDLPAGTHVIFSVRNADTLEVLAESDWIPFASVTEATQQGSRDLGALINQIGGKYLELEITMYMDNPEFDEKGCVPSNAYSPRFKKFSITSECTSIVVVV